MTRDQFGAWVLIYAAFLVPLAMLAIAEVRAAWRQTSRANLDAVMREERDDLYDLEDVLDELHDDLRDSSDELNHFSAAIRGQCNCEGCATVQMPILVTGPDAQDDPARVEQMAAIAEAEEAWGRDVWGGR